MTEKDDYIEIVGLANKICAINVIYTAFGIANISIIFL